MTREEAIEKLELLRQKVDEETYRALILAIKALEQMPEVTSTMQTGQFVYVKEPCDDAISREAVLDTTICEGISCNECSFNEIDGESGCLLHVRIDELPSVTQKSGKWLLNKEKSHFFDVYECSNCGKISGLTNYCPNCGAKMESEDKDANSN